MAKRWVGIAACMMALAVCLGAFGAHGLRQRLTPYSMEVYEKGVLYHFVHALGLCVVPLFELNKIITTKASRTVCVMFLVGIILFSGSLYALALTDIKLFGAITPVGGVSFIVAWTVLGFSCFKRRASGSGLGGDNTTWKY